MKNRWENVKKTKQEFCFIMSRVFRFSGFPVILLMLLQPLMSYLGIKLSLMMKSLYDEAILVRGIPYDTVFSMLWLVLVQGALVIFLSWLSLYVNEKLTNEMQRELTRHICTLPFSDINVHHTAFYQTLFYADVNTVTNTVTSIFPSVLRIVSTGIGAFAVLWSIDPRLLIAPVTVSPFVLLAALPLIGYSRRFHIRQMERSAGVRTYLQDILANIAVMKVFAPLEKILGVLIHKQQEKTNEALRYNLISSISKRVMSMIALAGLITSMGVGASMVATSVISVGTMLTLTQLSNNLIWFLSSFSRSGKQLIGAMASARRLKDILDLPPEEPVVPLSPPKDGLAVVFDRVSFSYDGRKIVNDLSLTLKPGTITALVGESGVGKTTLIRLLLGLLTPESGSVVMKHGEYSEKAGASTRQWCSYTPQGNLLLSGTIRENISMMRDDISQEDIEQAARIAQAQEFISRLPDGLDTVIGEQGAFLSEGQRQRLSIARSFAADSPILILDEITSSLDAATEKAVLQGIRENLGNRVCIIVTHRMAVLEYCDETIQLNREEGDAAK